jgi:hypothetical protein
MNDHFVDPVMHIILRVCGVVFIFWGLMLLLSPIKWIAGFLYLIGPSGDFNAMWGPSNLLFYMFRTSGIMCVWIGGSFLIAADDPSGNSGWTRFSGWMMLLFGAVGFLAPFLYDLPPALFFADASLALIGALFLLRLGRWRVPDLGP